MSCQQNEDLGSKEFRKYQEYIQTSLIYSLVSTIESIILLKYFVYGSLY